MFVSVCCACECLCGCILHVCLNALCVCVLCGFVHVFIFVHVAYGCISVLICLYVCMFAHVCFFVCVSGQDGGRDMYIENDLSPFRLHNSLKHLQCLSTSTADSAVRAFIADIFQPAEQSAPRGTGQKTFRLSGLSSHFQTSRLLLDGISAHLHQYLKASYIKFANGLTYASTL